MCSAQGCNRTFGNAISSATADGALTAQQGARVICSESCRNAALVARDDDHEVQRALGVMSEKDPQWSVLEYLLNHFW